MTDFRLLQRAEELFPGYIERAVESGLLMPDEAKTARENKALVELIKTSERSAQAEGHLTLEEAFVIEAFRESD